VWDLFVTFVEGNMEMHRVIDEWELAITVERWVILLKIAQCLAGRHQRQGNQEVLVGALRGQLHGAE
jgi:hypothetical protein